MLYALLSICSNNILNSLLVIEHMQVRSQMQSTTKMCGKDVWYQMWKYCTCARAKYYVLYMHLVKLCVYMHLMNLQTRTCLWLACTMCRTFNFWLICTVVTCICQLFTLFSSVIIGQTMKLIQKGMFRYPGDLQ